MSKEKAYQFFRLVERMRKAQKEYFKYRTSTVLNESKRLEKEVDDEISRVNNLLLDKQQPKLFNEQ
jgi:hypothetical protein